MGKAAEKAPADCGGELEISVKFHAKGSAIAAITEKRSLPFLLKKEQLPMAEARIIEAMESITNPFRVEVVSYINKTIEEEFNEETVEPITENTLPLDEKIETETT